MRLCSIHNGKYLGVGSRLPLPTQRERARNPSRTFKVFVATDETEFLEWMRKVYGDANVFYWDESPRASAKVMVD